MVWLFGLEGAIIQGSPLGPRRGDWGIWLPTGEVGVKTFLCCCWGCCCWISCGDRGCRCCCCCCFHSKLLLLMLPLLLLLWTLKTRNLTFKRLKIGEWLSLLRKGFSLYYCAIIIIMSLPDLTFKGKRTFDLKNFLVWYSNYLPLNVSWYIPEMVTSLHHHWIFHEWVDNIWWCSHAHARIKVGWVRELSWETTVTSSLLLLMSQQKIQ